MFGNPFYFVFLYLLANPLSQEKKKKKGQQILKFPFGIWTYSGEACEHEGQASSSFIPFHSTLPSTGSPGRLLTAGA